MRRMNLLPKNLLRGVALAAAACALVFVTAPAASAADPLWTAGQARVVMSPNINWLIVDDESWKDDLTSFYVPNEMWGVLGWNQKSFFRSIERCGGDEVRVVLEVAGTTNVFQVMDVKARLKLYEGASCATTDLDGQSPWKHFQMRPGEYLSPIALEVKNTEEGGDESRMGFSLRVPL
jgi:hypothetical protein